MFTGFYLYRAISVSRARGRLVQTLLAASLAGAGFVHAADDEKPAVQRPIEVTHPRAASDASSGLTAPAERPNAAKRYGSGYEARGLDTAKGDPGSTASAQASSASAPARAIVERNRAVRGGTGAPAGAQRGHGAGRGGRL